MNGDLRLELENNDGISIQGSFSIELPLSYTCLSDDHISKITRLSDAGRRIIAAARDDQGNIDFLTGDYHFMSLSSIKICIPPGTASPNESGDTITIDNNYDVSSEWLINNADLIVAT